MLSAFVDALARPWLDPASRTWWAALAASVGVAACVGAWRGALRRAVVDALGWGRWGHPSARTDAALYVLRRLAAGAGLGASAWSATYLAARVTMGLDRLLGAPNRADALGWIGVGVVSLLSFLVSDASRFVVHVALHRVPALWAFHQVHHSAEVMTPLTFHRIHPVEAALYAVRGTLVTALFAGVAFWALRQNAPEWTVLGVGGLGLVANAVSGNLRHSHFAWRWGALEAWLLSPAQHQQHHARDGARTVNLGTWVALWDRLAGTWAPSPPVMPAFGLAEGAGNHDPHSVVDALLGPFRGLGKARAWVAFAAVLGSVNARADDDVTDDPQAADEAATPVVEPEEDPASWGEMVIVGDSDRARVAGSATVIDEAELKRYAYDDIHRILARAPGVYVRGEDGYGLRPNIGIRGVSSDRSSKIALMEDGVLFGPAPYAAPAAYYFPMPVRLVGVEVIKGAGAVRYGPNTVGGAINLRTRDVPDAPSGAVDLAGGMYGTLRAHAWGGTGGEKGGVLAEFAHLGTSGFKHLPDGGPTGFERQDLMVKGRIALDDAGVHALELKGGWGRERSNETYLGLTLEDFAADPYQRYAASQNDLMRWQRGHASLAWTAEGAHVQARTVAYAQVLHRTWRKINRFADGSDLHAILLGSAAGQAGVYQAILRGEADTGSADQVLQLGTNDRRFTSGGVQSTVAWSAGTGVVRNRLEVGLRLHADGVGRLHTEDGQSMTSGVLVPTGAPTLVLLDRETSAQAVAAHLHDDLLVGRVRFTPGVRVEAIRTTSLDASAAAAGEAATVDLQVVALPGFGVLGQATGWLDVFAGVHRGFSPVAPGQPDGTRPELSWNVEAGGRGASRGLHGELVGFWSEYQNLVGACTFSAGCPEEALDAQLSGGRARIAGLEAVFGQEHEVGRGVELSSEVTYTYTHARFLTSFLSAFPQYGDVDAGDALPYVPEHLGALRFSVAHPRVTASLAANLRGAMRDLAGSGVPDAVERVPAAFSLDLSVEVPVWGPVAAYATATNVTNRANLESFRPFGARPSAPATVLVGVRVRRPSEER
jgi:Fe(3+) dicitrate transport protein